MVRFEPWDIEGTLERCASSDENGNTEIISREEYIDCRKKGLISNILPMYENIPGFLDRSYDDWPEIEIYSSILYGNPEHKRKQAEALKELGIEVYE